MGLSVGLLLQALHTARGKVDDVEEIDASVGRSFRGGTTFRSSTVQVFPTERDLRQIHIPPTIRQSRTQTRTLARTATGTLISIDKTETVTKVKAR